MRWCWKSSEQSPAFKRLSSRLAKPFRVPMPVMKFWLPGRRVAAGSRRSWRRPGSGPVISHAAGTSRFDLGGKPRRRDSQYVAATAEQLGHSNRGAYFFAPVDQSGQVSGS
jgi:hypothetical protein